MDAAIMNQPVIQQRLATMLGSSGTSGFRDVRYNDLYEGYNDYDDQFNGAYAHRQVGVVENAGISGDFTVYDHVVGYSGSSSASEYQGGKACEASDYFNIDRTSTVTPTPLNLPSWRPPSVGRPRSVASTLVTDSMRPMTAGKAAGYTSRGSRFDPFNQAAGCFQGTSQKKEDANPTYVAREMERHVNQILEASATAGLAGQHSVALEKAKEAGKRERLLCKHREQAGLADELNNEFTFAVCFNLGYQYQKNGLESEALHTYSQIVKSKQFPHSGRLRVNMGNIYYEQKKYSLALKMYRMALDQTSTSYKETRYRIMRNIGNALMRIGQFQDAVQSYESVMEIKVDHQTSYNLIVCYYVLGNAAKMKITFTKMLLVRHYDPDADDDGGIDQTSGFRSDDLREELLSRQSQTNKYIIISARLIAPVIGETLEEGYNWIIDLLQDQRYLSLAHEMEMDKAIQYLHRQDFKQAITLLKEFEKKEKGLQARAATNLSFFYYLEGDVLNAEKHAELAVRTNRYNACALVNRGNCLYAQGNIEGARALYAEAVDAESDCVEAVYNLGLTYKRLGAFQEAMDSFKKLTQILPNSIEVLFQMGHVLQLMQSPQQAIKWFEIVITKVMHDAGVLKMLGDLYVKCSDEVKALHYYSESHRVHPTNVDITSWLGNFYVKNELYEKALPFFELASKIQPDEVEWRLMEASCYRRTGAYSMALEKYREILSRYPSNAECLRSLVHMCTSLGKKSEAHNYELRLRKVERDPIIDSIRDAAGTPSSLVSEFSNFGFKTFMRSTPVKKDNRTDEDWEVGEDLLPI